MEINFLNNVRFGQATKAPVKTLFISGAFGDKVKKGFYGEYITKRNVSLEHLQPKSQNGRNDWNNLVLTAKNVNHKRATIPLKDIINLEAAKAYLEQFRDIDIPGRFNGKAYIRMITKKLQEMGISLDSMIIDRQVKSRPRIKHRRFFFR